MHLHVHLESAVRPSTVVALAAKYGVVAPSVVGPCRGFREFAGRADLVKGLLREFEDFARVAEEFCVDQAADGVRWVEVTFTAASHEERLGAVGMPLAGVVAGLERGVAVTGLGVRVVLDHSRRRSVARMARTVDLALGCEWVVGVGVAGEERYSLVRFAGELARAREAGLRVVHHAGEQCGAASVVEAVRVGLAERIGHGVGALEDVGVVAELRDRGVAVEACPGSNVALGVVGSWAEHPLSRLVEAGVVVSLGTDVPLVTGLSLSGEFAAVRSGLGLSDSELAGLAVGGAVSSFAPEGVKAQVVAGVEAWLGAGVGGMA
ncbi:adenosine deaminase [Actinokineospora pegani]|uniref:adenosine deaminase n=1 Tax=Actinokineospora pegani TaxID=2654637 RepID=UPI002E266F00